MTRYIHINIEDFSKEQLEEELKRINDNIATVDGCFKDLSKNINDIDEYRYRNEGSSLIRKRIKLKHKKQWIIKQLEELEGKDE